MQLKESDIFRIIKLLYIIILISSLIALRDAIGMGSLGFEHVNEGYLRPVCDKIFAINGVLTAFFIIFRERVKLCTK